MKHCTTDKCPQILDSSCVFYEGASLIFSGINTNDSVEIVIQKLNLKLESFPGINLDNYYTKNEADNLFLNYYIKTETYSQTQIDNFVSNLELEIDNKANLSDVYLKNETYSQTEINGFLSGKQNTIGYTPENVANKSDSYTASSSTTYASTKALVDGLATKLDKGTYTGTAQDLKNNIDKLSKTTDNVVATTTVGAINPGEIVPAGTNIQGLTELLLNKTFYPTFVNPTFGLTNNAGLREVGSSFNVSLTFNFNRGQILGKLDNGIWNPTMLQDYRAGVATSYLLNGVSGSNNSASFNVTTILGTNTLTGSVTYATGAQPKDSKNNDFESPFPAGTSPIQSTSFEGIYPYFYYKSTSPITPAIMQSAIANGQATKVLASSTGTITIPFAANGEYIAVAYPETSTTKTIWYVNALDNGEIPGGLLGGVNTLPCNSPTNLWSNVNLKIHVSAGLITQPNPIQLKNS